MNIILTGNKGFIGSYLEPRLKELGHTVYGVDKKRSREQDLTNLNTRFFRKLAMKKVDLIIHLAAQSMVRKSVENPKLAEENFISTFNILEFARKNKIKKIIFSSSRETYGNLEQWQCRETNSRTWNVESPYAATKAAGEALLNAYRVCYGIDYVIVRLSNVFGLNDPNRRFIPILFEKLPKNETVEIYGEEKEMDFTWINDCILGFEATINKFDKLARGRIPIYNIAYGKSEKLYDVAVYLKKLIRSKSEIKVTKNFIGEVVKYQANINKFCGLTNWRPAVYVYKGLKFMWDFYSDK